MTLTKVKKRQTYDSQVLAVTELSSNTAMFHNPLVSAKLFTTIASIVAETPRTVHQILLRQANQIASLHEEAKQIK